MNALQSRFPVSYIRGHLVTCEMTVRSINQATTLEEMSYSYSRWWLSLARSFIPVSKIFFERKLPESCCHSRSPQRLINYSTAMSRKGTSFSLGRECCSRGRGFKNRTSENLKNRLRNLISEIFSCFADRDEWIFLCRFELVVEDVKMTLRPSVPSARKLPTWVFHSVPTLEHVWVNFTRDVSKLGEEKSRNNGLEGGESTRQWQEGICSEVLIRVQFDVWWDV